MIQVKEFLNHQTDQDKFMNEWLREQGDSIEIVDIKYSVGCFPPDEAMGWATQEFSGALIIYETK